MIRNLFPIVTLALLVACAGKDDTGASEDTATDDSGDTADTAETGDTGDTGIDCATDAWADQTADTKSAWMNACVLPVLKPIYQAYDAEKYADFGCATCHANASTGDYTMPAVYALDWSYQKYWAKNGVYVGDGSGFMEQVTSSMVTVLGKEPYDYKTGEGFGCYGCHLFQ